VPVVSGVCDGFIGNRMLEKYGQQSLFLLEGARDDLEQACVRLEPEVGMAPPLVRQVSSTLLDIYQRRGDVEAARAHRARAG
jgi:hypothetical protein